MSLYLIRSVGPAGTAWLRLTMGALIFMAWRRPPLRTLRTRDIPDLLGLGIMNGLATVAFLGAVARIPLGTTVGIEFLGPLSVAALGTRRTRALVWPITALLGVVLLTNPWGGRSDPVGIALAGFAAIGWGTYILLTQRVGDRFAGARGLSLTVPVAAATAAVAGIPQAAGHITPTILAAAVGLAILFPVLPYALEMRSLHFLTPSAFGTLMALEPAFGVIIGFVVLGQRLSMIQLTGVLLVVGAGARAQRGGRRKERVVAGHGTS